MKELCEQILVNVVFITFLVIMTMWAFVVLPIFYIPFKIWTLFGKKDKIEKVCKNFVVAPFLIIGIKGWNEYEKFILS